MSHHYDDNEEQINVYLYKQHIKTLNAKIEKIKNEVKKLPELEVEAQMTYQEWNEKHRN